MYYLKRFSSPVVVVSESVQVQSRTCTVRVFPPHFRLHASAHFSRFAFDLTFCGFCSLIFFCMFCFTSLPQVQSRKRLPKSNQISLNIYVTLCTVCAYVVFRRDVIAFLFLVREIVKSKTSLGWRVQCLHLCQCVGGAYQRFVMFGAWLTASCSCWYMYIVLWKCKTWPWHWHSRQLYMFMNDSCTFWVNQKFSVYIYHAYLSVKLRSNQYERLALAKSRFLPVSDYLRIDTAGGWCKFPQHSVKWNNSESPPKIRLHVERVRNYIMCSTYHNICLIIFRVPL